MLLIQAECKPSEKTVNPLCYLTEQINILLWLKKFSFILFLFGFILVYMTENKESHTHNRNV